MKSPYLVQFLKDTFDRPSVLVKRLAVFLCLVAIILFFFELRTMREEDFIELADKHHPAPLLANFAGFVLTSFLSLIFLAFIAVINCAAVIHWMIQHNQGHLVFLTILAFSSIICLVIYGLKASGVLNGDHQEAFGISGTGGLAITFGFLQGYNLRSDDPPK